MNELEKLIALSKVVAKPWVIATWVDAVDVQVNYVDENNLTLTANTSVTVSGVVSI